MTTTIDDSRAEVLADARAKRATALRFARTGNASEEEYWLRIADRMTTWIEHLERNAARAERSWPERIRGTARAGINLPPSARRSRPAPFELKL